MSKNIENIIVGVLGAGRIGQVHIKAMSSLPFVTIKRVTDPFMNDEIETILKSFGAQICSKSADDIFNDKEISAVFICAPTDTHSDFSLRAIATHKHVFCEKPVDMELSRILEVRSALNSAQESASAKKIVYQVGFNRRFDHNMEAAREAVVSGKIGTPQMLRITSRDPAPPSIEYIKTSGGLFMDMMIHDFDMARFQIGSDIEEVYAIAGVLIDGEIGKGIEAAGDVDSAIVTLKFKNGAIGFIENCRKATYGYDQRVEVLGTEGAVKTANDKNSTAIISNDKGETSEKPLHFFLERYKDAYIKEQRAFFDAILQGKPAPCGIEEGYESVRIAYAAKLSLKENRPVRIEEI